VRGKGRNGLAGSRFQSGTCIVRTVSFVEGKRAVMAHHRASEGEMSNTRTYPRASGGGSEGRGVLAVSMGCGLAKGEVSNRKEDSSMESGYNEHQSLYHKWAHSKVGAVGRGLFRKVVRAWYPRSYG
jgi:hypothetical protein